jgi:predicted RNA binding protein YcfA (HicA-like mRNA interferase family)
VPRLKCTFAEFIGIIEANGFALLRHGGTSHRRYRGVIDGRVRLVDVAYHNISDDVLPRTLASMIRQSGLPKDLFRK